MRMRKFSVILIIISLFCLIILSEAKPTSHDVGSYEITDFPVYNSCNDDYLRVSGVIHYNVQLNIDAQGGVHWQSHAHHNLTGETIDGTQYQVISTVNQKGNLREGGFPYAWSFINTSPLISKGGEPNLLFKYRCGISRSMQTEKSSLILLILKWYVKDERFIF